MSKPIKHKTMRDFLNDEKSMPGNIITDFDYHYSRKDLEIIWLKISDCRKMIELEFALASKKDLNASLKKAKRIQKHINKIVETLENHEAPNEKEVK